MFRRFQQWLCKFLGFTPTETAPPDMDSALSRQQEVSKEEIARYDRSLAATANLCVVLRNQIRKLEAEESRLQTALEAHVKAGEAEGAGGELALRWQTTVDELAERRKQLQEAERRRAEIAMAREEALESARKKLAEMKKGLE